MNNLGHENINVRAHGWFFSPFYIQVAKEFLRVTVILFYVLVLSALDQDLEIS